MAAAFKGKPPGSGAGEMSRRSVALRPAIALDEKQRDKARRLRRQGLEPHEIAEALEAPVEEVEKALVQMRSRRPETTRGTLNVTLAAHRLVQAERRGGEPVWVTFDRMLDELLRLRAEREARSRRAPPEGQAALPLLFGGGGDGEDGAAQGRPSP